MIYRPKKVVRVPVPKGITASEAAKGEVLVAIMNNKRDFTILQERLWYRIPVETAPKHWPPKWLAFYLTKPFGKEAFNVRYFGRVREIKLSKRTELFPDEPPNKKTDRVYHQLFLDSLEPLAPPIPSARWRRIVFIPTTMRKFNRAKEINDLFDESPLEDLLWEELKDRRINAERQWGLRVDRVYYELDFAVFCNKGRVDVELDGDLWHSTPERIPLDNARNNALTSTGWSILRYNTFQVRESMEDYCIPSISRTITQLGGLSRQGLIPESYFSRPSITLDQLPLLEDPPESETKSP